MINRQDYDAQLQVRVEGLMACVDELRHLIEKHEFDSASSSAGALRIWLDATTALANSAADTPELRQDDSDTA